MVIELEAEVYTFRSQWYRLEENRKNILILKAVEYEKGTIRSQRETLKKNKEKFQTERIKLEAQKRELGKYSIEIH